jgi:hypothetical protein
MFVDAHLAMHGDIIKTALERESDRKTIPSSQSKLKQ